MTNATYGRLARQDIFQLAIEEFLAWQQGDPEPTIDYDGQVLTLTEACNMARNLPDIYPASAGWDDLREVLDMKSATYAAVARALRRHLQTH